MSILSRVLDLKEEHRLTHELIANEAGVIKQTIQKQLQKEVDSVKTVVAVSKLTNARIEWIITGKGEKYNDDPSVVSELKSALKQLEDRIGKLESKD